MGVQERLDALRSTSGIPAAVVDAGANDATQRLVRWRAEKGLDGKSPLRDPTVVYSCGEGELHEILNESRMLRQMSSMTPEWVCALNQAWSRGKLIAHAAPIPTYDDFDRGFLRIVRPFIAYGVERLSNETAAALHVTGTAAAPFTVDSVVATLRETLEMRLAELVCRTAVLELHAARVGGQLAGATSAARFGSFHGQLGDFMVSEAILRRSPVLARLGFVITQNWIDANRQFLHRLAVDWSELQEVFGLDQNEAVSEVTVMGDFHRGGRAVLRIRFESGRRLIYKPRSVDVEMQFQKLLDQFAPCSELAGLRRLNMIPRHGYGWLEHVDEWDCAASEIPRLYERYGVLLAVLHVLGATDCHFENIVKSGAHPVVVDLEALFHAFPSAPVEALGPAEQDAFEATTTSVLAVGLLPSRRWSNALGRSIDVSGLGARSSEWEGARRCRWERPYTDEMREILDDPRQGMESIGSRDGDGADPLFDQAGSVAKGFTYAYRALAANGRMVLDPGGAVDRFDGLETRAILRPTGHYVFTLQSLSHPSFLHDGTALDQRIDRLIEVDDGRPGRSPLAVAERHQLWQMDVPLFLTHPGTRDIWSDADRFQDFRSESGLDRVRRRVAAMSEDDLEHQVWLIRLALAAWTMNQRGVHEGDEKDSRRLPTHGSATVMSCAAAMGERLHQLAFRRDGEAMWLGMHYRPGDESWSVGAVGPSLFDGTGGVALFLAYLADTTDDARHLRLAQEAARTFERQLGRVLGSKPNALVGFSGIGGWVYVLSHLSALWDETRFAKTAAALTLQLEHALTTAVTVDVIGGAAGAIRPLLALYAQSGDEEFLRSACSCGDHIIAAARPQHRGVGWNSPAGEIPLAGFAHGVAGISWALLKLYEETNAERYRRTAVAGLEYERSLFSAEAGNWHDLRFIEATGDAANAPFAPWWCSGSAGIGLARIDNLEIHNDEHTAAEITAAIRSTGARGFRDHCLCHGWGTAAELMMLADLAGFPTKGPATWSCWADEMLGDIRKNGYVTGAPNGVEVPGLMMGIAGIGYALLRLSHPDRIPSVALLEPSRRS